MKLVRWYAKQSISNERYSAEIVTIWKDKIDVRNLFFQLRAGDLIQ